VNVPTAVTAPLTSLNFVMLKVPVVGTPAIAPSTVNGTLPLRVGAAAAVAAVTETTATTAAAVRGAPAPPVERAPFAP
jgi:hypothetical protein